MYNEEFLIADMISAGAKGYLLKNTNRHELTDAIKAAYNDQPYYSNQKSERVALMIAKGGNYGNKNNPATFTSREKDVIQKICEGLSSKQIAAELRLATRTVERYRDGIMRKMKVHNSAALVRYAISNGLFRSNEIGK
jgi:DNA-binding NarL/FixJ family response regulator